jgi:hypothetical protein
MFGWVPLKIVSVSAVLYPIWPPLLKIEISSNGQNCSILSQNVAKFELYKHNDELFNMYYRTFYELWTFADFDWLCKLEKRGDEIIKKSSSETTGLISTKLCWDDSWVVLLPKLCPWPSWQESTTAGHNFGRGPSNDYSIKVWFQLSNWFQTRRFLCEFPIGSYVKLSSAVGPSWSKDRTAWHIFGRE